MEETKNFDPAEFGLIPVSLAEWAGFVFLKFGTGGEEIDDHLGNLSATSNRTRRNAWSASIGAPTMSPATGSSAWRTSARAITSRSFTGER